MNYEKYILELEKRIEVLEKAEQKRIKKRKREIIFKLIKYITIIVLIILTITYINNNYIKPYKEKIDNVENFINEKWNIIQNFNPFS